MKQSNMNLLNKTVKDILSDLIKDNERLSKRSDLMLTHIVELMDQREEDRGKIETLSNKCKEQSEKITKLKNNIKHHHKMHINTLLRTTKWYSTPHVINEIFNNRINVGNEGLILIYRWFPLHGSFLLSNLGQSNNLDKFSTLICKIIDSLNTQINNTIKEKDGSETSIVIRCTWCYGTFGPMYGTCQINAYYDAIKCIKKYVDLQKKYKRKNGYLNIIEIIDKQIQVFKTRKDDVTKYIENLQKAKKILMTQ